MLNKALILLFCLFPMIVYAAAEPSWVLYEKGLDQMEKGEFGEALLFLKQAVTRRVQEAEAGTESSSTFPEALAAMGDIYRLYQPQIAEEHYLKAYAQKDNLYVKQDKYAILYKLADLYKNYFSPPKYGEMEATLWLVIKEDGSAYYNETFLQFKTQLLKNLTNKDLNRIMVLYRFHDNIRALAHAELAWYMLRIKKDYLEAATHYLFYSVLVLTKAIEDLMDADLDFKFTNIADFFKRAQAEEELQVFFADTQLFKNLYLFAESLYMARTLTWPAAAWIEGVGGPDNQKQALERACLFRTRSLLELVLYYDLSGEYRPRAEKQLGEWK